jgi:acyl-CoA thioesterase
MRQPEAGHEASPITPFLSSLLEPSGGGIAGQIFYFSPMNPETLKSLFKQDLFAAHAGIELLDVAPGRAVARMPIAPHHKNGLGSVHGGAIFTLADFTFAAAANSHGTVAVAINVSINFMKAVTEGTLTAEAREISVNPKLGTYTIDIKDEHDHLVAVFQGLAYRKKDALPLA